VDKTADTFKAEVEAPAPMLIEVRESLGLRIPLTNSIQSCGSNWEVCDRFLGRVLDCQGRFVAGQNIHLSSFPEAQCDKEKAQEICN
jgi:hypothetical protein